MRYIIDFPEVRQSKNYTCGVSALQAILYFYGISYREDELESLLHVTETNGTEVNAVVNFCRQLGFHVTTKSNMTISQLQDYIKHDRPVLVVYQAWGSSGNDYQNVWSEGHYSVIIGFDGNKIIFEDPSLIGKGYLTINNFLHRWHDIDSHGRQYNGFGIIIDGKKVKYHSDIVQEIM